jgi:hypothetical protein
VVEEQVVVMEQMEDLLLLQELLLLEVEDLKEPVVLQEDSVHLAQERDRLELLIRVLQEDKVSIHPPKMTEMLEEVEEQMG